MRVVKMLWPEVSQERVDGDESGRHPDSVKDYNDNHGDTSGGVNNIEMV